MKVLMFFSICIFLLLSACSTKPRIVKSPCVSMNPNDPCVRRPLGDLFGF